MKTRLATPSDAGAISNVICRSITACCAEDHRNEQVLIDAWLRNKTADNVASWIVQPGNFCVAAVVEEDLAGFGMAQGERILLCYVLPDFLGKGVGRALFRTIELQAIERGDARLDVESTRTAMRFYERQGFRRSGPAISAFGMTAQPMSKYLAGSARPEAGIPPA